MTVMSVAAIRFRPLAESDLPTLVGWFAEPEIARWWNQSAEIENVRAKYLPRIEAVEFTARPRRALGAALGCRCRARVGVLQQRHPSGRVALDGGG